MLRIFTSAEYFPEVYVNALMVYMTGTNRRPGTIKYDNF